MLSRASVVFLAIVAGACHGARGPDLPAFPTARDPAYDLADLEDRRQVRDHYDALPSGDPARPALRGELAVAYAARIDAGLAADDNDGRDRAARGLLDLISLWSAAELDRDGGATELAPWVALAGRARAVFSRRGSAGEAIAALVAEAAGDPAHRRDAEGELDAILAYADDLAIADQGALAARARPIELLRTVAPWAPARLVIDRLVPLLVARQQAADASARQGGVTTELLRAHGASVLHASREIVLALAHAGRIAEAPAALAPVHGLGDDPTLREQLTAALASGASGEDWAALAATVRAGGDDDDPAGAAADALAIGREGLVRLPDDIDLLTATAGHAGNAGRIQLALRLAETALARDPGAATAASQLAVLYHARLGELVRTGRVEAARAQLRRLETFHRDAAAHFPDRALDSDLAEARATMGRGLADHGELAEAERELRASLAARPTLDAVEVLATLAFAQDRFAETAGLARKALAIIGDTLEDEAARAHVLRTCGEAYASLGDQDHAIQLWRAALEVWDGLGKRWELDAGQAGERLLEAGKALWDLGNQVGARVAFDAAVDADPDGADTLLGVLAFALTADDRPRAIDVLHRTLGSRVDDDDKVHAALWERAEARRRGDEPDRLAGEFLAARDGRLWSDALARLATGRAQLVELVAQATSRGRRASLLYYAAAFGTEPERRAALLAGVVATRMVMFFEYDRARAWLAAWP